MKMFKQLFIGAAAAAVCVGCATTPAVCPVSGEGLASMGGPFVLDHKGQKVKLCCEGCKEDFEKEPDRFLAIIRGEAPAPKPEE